MRNVYEKVLINIDTELFTIEQFYLRVKPILPYCRFVRNRRYPVDNETLRRLNYTHNEVSPLPFMPFLCVNDIKAFILYSVYSDKLDTCSPTIKELFERNELLEDGGENFLDNINRYPLFYLDKTVLRSCDENERKSINRSLDSIMSVVSYYTNKYPNNVFDMNFEYAHVYIENLGEIGSYRYFEYLQRRRLG